MRSASLLALVAGGSGSGSGGSEVAVAVGLEINRQKTTGSRSIRKIAESIHTTKQ